MDAASLAESTQFSAQNLLVGQSFVRSLPGIEPIKGVVESYIRPCYHIKCKSGYIKLSPLELMRSLERNAIGYKSQQAETLVGKFFALNDENEIFVMEFIPGRFIVKYENGHSDEILEEEVQAGIANHSRNDLTASRQLISAKRPNRKCQPLVWCRLTFEIRLMDSSQPIISQGVNDSIRIDRRMLWYVWNRNRT